MKKPSSRSGNVGALLLAAAFLIPLGILVLRQSSMPEDAPVSGASDSSPSAFYHDSLLTSSPPAASGTAVQLGALQEGRYPAAPDFERVTLEGTSLRLSSQRGRVIVLNFWATWCAPCRFEIPAFVELQQELGPEGLRFIGMVREETLRPVLNELLREEAPADGQH